MPSVNRWNLDCGAVVIKYRMAPNYFRWLRYEKGEPLEGGDYTSHGSLKEAKEYDTRKK